MVDNQRVVVARKDGVSLYARVIDNKRKLGQYEVEYDFFRSQNRTFYSFKEAETAMSSAIGVRQTKVEKR